MVNRPDSDFHRTTHVKFTGHPTQNYIFPVKVYSSKGDLKHIISVEEIKNRPMGKGVFDNGNTN